MKTICIDARTITADPSGVGRYASSLLPELARRSPSDVRLIVLRHDSNWEPLAGPDAPVEQVFVGEEIDGWAHYLRGQSRLESVLRDRAEIDLYHSLFHVLPADVRDVLGTIPVVLTLHDLVWVDHPEHSQDHWLAARAIEFFGRTAIWDALRTADRVVAVSPHTARRASTWIDSDRIRTIPHGVAESFFDDDESGAPVAEPPYVAAVGNDKEYKNLGTLVEAFARIADDYPGLELVLIGGCDGLIGDVRRLGLEDRVHFPGFVDEERLRSTLRCANVFAFPSLIEGFGLPVLEAMASGTATVVSDLEPMRSVAGDAARRVDPRSAGELARALDELIGRPELRAEYERLGRERASGFRWSRTADETWGVYRELLEG
ncbi:MAG: glycosyltransferase family 4 protein [Bradymonadaceae bacterium]